MISHMDRKIPERASSTAGADSELPFISVVMPVRNEAQTIQAVINALLAQEYPADRFEIIVCDGCSTDRSAEIVQGIAALDQRVVLVRNEGRLSSAGRNLGYRHARGDVILYVDGHCLIPDRDLLSSIAELFAATGASCLCRPQPLVPDEQNSTWASAIAAVRASPVGHSRSSYIFSDHEGFVNPISAGAAYTREVFQRIGEFDESFDACEDVEFNFRVERAGFTSYISPRLKVLYHARRSLSGLYRQMSRYGRGRFQLLRKHPDAFEWQMAVPPAGVVISVVALLAIIFVPPLRGPLVAGVLFGYILTLLLTLPGGKSCNWRGWPLYPLVFFAVYWGLGVGFLRAALTDARSNAVRVGSGSDTRKNPVR